MPLINVPLSTNGLLHKEELQPLSALLKQTYYNQQGQQAWAWEHRDLRKLKLLWLTHLSLGRGGIGQGHRPWEWWFGRSIIGMAFKLWKNFKSVCDNTRRVDKCQVIEVLEASSLGPGWVGIPSAWAKLSMVFSEFIKLSIYEFDLQVSMSPKWRLKEGSKSLAETLRGRHPEVSSR